MTFSGHIATSALVLKATQNPFAIITACLLLHLVADAIPHAEYQPWKKASLAGQVMMILDSGATLLLIFLLYRNAASPWLVSLAIGASLLPDLTDRPARRHLPRWRRWHLFMHTWPQPAQEPTDWSRTVTGRTPTWLKVTLQAGLVLGVYLWLAR